MGCVLCMWLLLLLLLLALLGLWVPGAGHSGYVGPEPHSSPCLIHRRQ